MAALHDELRQLLLEQAQAESEAQRAYAARREEVRGFLNNAVLVAYRDLSIAFSQHGLGRRVEFDRDLALDHPQAVLTVRNARDTGSEFIYELEVIYNARKLFC